MNEIFEDPKLRREYRYGGHSFIPKEKIPTLQAADVLSWQTHAHRKRRAQRPEVPLRKDFEALCRAVPHKLVHMTAERIIETRDTMLRYAADAAEQSA